MALDCADDADVATNAQVGRRATVSILLPIARGMRQRQRTAMFAPLESRSSEMERHLVDMDASI